MYFLTYIVFTVGLGLYMAVVVGGAVKTEIPDRHIKTGFENNDASGRGQQIHQILVSDEIRPLVDLVSEEKADYKVIVPEGFEKGEPIRILGKGSVSRMDGEILAMVIRQAAGAIQFHARAEASMSEGSLSEEERAEIFQQLAAVSDSHRYVEASVKPTDNLNIRQYYAVVMISYLMMYLVTAELENTLRPEKAGLLKRTKSLPITRVEYALMSVTSNALISFLTLWMYIGVWKLIEPNAFVGDLPLILLLTALQAVFVAVLSNFIGDVFTPKVRQVISRLMIFVVTILSGMLRMEDLFDLPMFEGIAKSNINLLSSVPYIELSNGGGFDSILRSVVALIGLSVLLFAGDILYLKAQKEWKK